jgi:uncharacterized protein YajQ (UPF0234 family)
MPSFDIVNELNLMEVENAVNQTQKEIGQRFDFKGGKSDIELDKVAKKLKITADDDFKLRSIHQILEGKLVKRSVDLRILKYEKEIPASGNVIRQEVILRSGIEKEDAKEITKAIKDSKLKVQAQIQDEQVRVTAKSIDELQATMAMLRGKDMKTPIQFVNMRS